MKLIEYNEPSSKRKNVKSLIIIAIIFLSFGILSNGWDGIKVMLPITITVLIVLTIEESFNKHFDGWKITNEGIELSRINTFKGLESFFIHNNTIKSIKYIQPQPKIPLAFIFNTTKGKKTLYPKMDIFKLAPILKYFYEKKIQIEYTLSDCEVDLYIKGKIDSLPMTNDMEIKN